MKTKHGNRNDSPRPHHLYQIEDREENDIYKFGICGKPLNKDGSSPRGIEQSSELNRADGWLRYFVRILQRNIPGRRLAKIFEENHIQSYKDINGRLPRGNDEKKKFR